jgi:hypothetical protein
MLLCFFSHVVWCRIERPREKTPPFVVLKFLKNKPPTRFLVSQFLQTGLTLEAAHAMRFEDLVDLLRTKPVIGWCKRCLFRIHMSSIQCHHIPVIVQPKQVNVKVFLAAYMIVTNRVRVFDRMGTAEEELFNSATLLLQNFEAICNGIREGRHFSELHTRTEQFPVLLADYLQKFQAWKTPDEAILVNRIKYALIALYRAADHMPPEDVLNNTPIHLEMTQQIVRLRQKLLRIIGQEQLDRFDRDRENNVGENMPAIPTIAINMNRHSNEALAHELLLDPEFRLVFDEELPTGPWDSFERDLRENKWDGMLQVFTAIQIGLCDVTNTTDLNHIYNMAEVSSHSVNNDWSWFATIIVSIKSFLSLHQSFVREQETADLWQQVQPALENIASGPDPVGAFCAGIKFCFQRIHAMRIDNANAQLVLISPVVRDHGIQFERNKFEEKRRVGLITLQVFEGLVGTVLRRNNAAELQTLLVDDLFTSKWHNDFVQLVIDSDSVPETLALDVHRIRDWQAVCSFLVRGVYIAVRLNTVNSPAHEAVVDYMVETGNAEGYAALIQDAEVVASLEHVNEPLVKLW